MIAIKTSNWSLVASGVRRIPSQRASRSARARKGARLIATYLHFKGTYRLEMRLICPTFRSRGAIRLPSKIV
jgi:hypothetical protein